MSWMVRAFDPVTDRVAEEVDLDVALQPVFRAMLRCPESDAMYDSYPLDEAVMGRINEMFGLELDAGQGHWFLEYERPNSRLADGIGDRT